MSLWVAGLISAGTAAVVTLLLEYAAKPSLEVRKERILEEHRTYREIRSLVVRLSNALGTSTMAILLGEEREDVEIGIAKDRSEACACAELIASTAASLPPRDKRRILDSLMTSAGVVAHLAADESLDSRWATQAAPWVIHMESYFKTYRWRDIQKRRRDLRHWQDESTARNDALFLALKPNSAGFPVPSQAEPTNR